jgi:hypothetical protein
MHAVSPHLRKAAARELGLNEQYLYQCLTGRVRTPVERCPGVERALGGLVTAEQLRPDVRWVRIPDESWPHPAGRPLIDVAAPAAEEPAHG